MSAGQRKRTNSCRRSYSDRRLTLTPTNVRNLVQEYVNLFPLQRRNQVTFQNDRPSCRWLQMFIARNNLEMKSVKVIEDKRVRKTSTSVKAGACCREHRKSQVLHDEIQHQKRQISSQSRPVGMVILAHDRQEFT